MGLLQFGGANEAPGVLVSTWRRRSRRHGVTHGPIACVTPGRRTVMAPRMSITRCRAAGGAGTVTRRAISSAQVRFLRRGAVTGPRSPGSQGVAQRGKVDL